MFKILSALIPFIKELFFDHKDEANFTSSRFNAKKWLSFALFIIALVLLMFETQRLFSLSLDYVHLQDQNKLLLKKQEEIQIALAKSEKELSMLQADIVTLEAQCTPDKRNIHLISRIKK